MKGEPNDFYSRSCDLSGHEWGKHPAGTRCIWCGTYQLYLTNAIRADRDRLARLVEGLHRDSMRRKREAGLGSFSSAGDAGFSYAISEVLALIEKEGESS